MLHVEKLYKSTIFTFTFMLLSHRRYKLRSWTQEFQNHCGQLSDVVTHTHILLIVGLAVTVLVCMCLFVCEFVCMSVCQYACQYVCCLLVYVWSEYVWSMCVVCICMATTYYGHTYLPRSTYLTSSEPAHTTWLLLIKQNSLMTLTLSCACYTNIPIDLGLHNQTCNCELNLSTVVSLIRDNFMFVYHCVF